MERSILRIAEKPGLIVWLSLVAAWLAWAPLELKAAGEPSDSLWFISSDSLLHLFFLLPLGCILGAEAARTRRPSALLECTVLLLLMGVVLEAGQLWLAVRSFSFFDLLFNFLGALLGLGLGVVFYRRGVGPARVALLTFLITFASLGAWTAHWMHEMRVGLTLAGWQADYPVMVGKEFGGDRFFRGTIEEPRLCAGNEDGKLCVQEHSSLYERIRMAEAAQLRQRVNVSAVIASDAERQFGPARIVSFSHGRLRRNLTLAQQEGDLHLRLRTPRAQENGAGLHFLLPRAVPQGEKTLVSGEYDQSVVRMRAHFDGMRVEGVFRPDFLFNSLELAGWGLNRFPRILHGRGAAGVTAILLLALGYLASALAQRRWLWTPLLAAPLLVACLWVVLDLLWLRIPPPDISRLLLLMVVAGIGALMATWDRQRRGGIKNEV